MSDLKTPVRLGRWGDHISIVDADGKTLVADLKATKEEMAEIVKRVNEHDMVVDLLVDFVEKECSPFNSSAIPQFVLWSTGHRADAVRFLANIGKAKIISEANDRMVAEWVKENPK